MGKKSILTTPVSRRGAITLGLGTVATLALAGCGGGGGSVDSASTGSASTGGSGSYKVAMIMSGTVTDGGWDQGHYESLKRAVESHPNWEMLEPKENTADVQSKIAEYADQIKSGSFLTDDEVSAIESTL